MCTVRIIIVTFIFNFNKIVNSQSVINLNNFNEDILNVSITCRNQLTNLNRTTLLKMFDASVKLPEGLLIPNFYNLGQFDECYNIEDQSIYGKYCLGSTTLSAFFNSSENIEETNNTIKSDSMVAKELKNARDLGMLHFGYCLSDGCTADDFHSLFKKFDFDEEYCYTRATAPELSTGAIVTISILCCVLTLVVLSTIFDIYLFYTETKNSHEFLIAFSALTNGKKLIRSSTNPNQLLCLNGLRAISMIWVVISHEYLNILEGPATNAGDLPAWLDNPFNTIFSSASITVDTFLTIGGILVAYTDLRLSSRSRSHFDVGLIYLHRYLRLTPLLGVMILIHSYLIEYLGNGPLWRNAYSELVADCRRNWWSGLIYLQNYFHGGGTCVPQSWYLSVDFQLFVLYPIVLIPLKKSRRVGLWILGGLIILGFLIPGLITYFYRLQFSFMAQNASNVEDFMFLYYKQTYARFGPYVIGLLAGYYIYNLKKDGKKLKLSTFNVLFLWCICLLTLIACIVGPYDILTTKEFQWKDALANATVRNIWAIAICILVLLCITGYGGPINWFLSLPLFQLISKLSYGIYLTHYAVIVIRYAQTKQAIFFSNQLLMWTFWGDFVVSCTLSVLFYFMFESPMVVIEKYLFASCMKTTLQKT